ncbi:branched-chain amino acid ABC transporter permease [Kurthia sibirica]|uniref:Branched-chain amino acid ABC transporter permease n=1 Tax=Kurthia sibirica TaxID=202750 RepID=A0A2U3ANT2_9BACL|nr:branched-chain amino acid ABC transporter permease [Kurthia sibirica]PWI26210.1 branched-chain amino acid ABC transporter permease [Kurthia sibirica]GEK34723.1 branched-chain amino acid ABC transporter permease [Kurthia sibirica]
MKRNLKIFNGILFVLLVILILSPIVLDDQFILNVLIQILMYATIATAWNLLGGYAGQLSLGHALFFGIGAYTATILHINYGISPWLGMIIVVAVCIILCAIIGLPTFRLKGPFFTLATIAFAEVARHLALYWRELTNGSVGINIKFDPSFTNMIFQKFDTYYLLILLLLVVTLFITYCIDRNKMGYYLKAIREDEDAAKTLGINATKYKMYALILSASITGIVGVFYAQFILFFEPESVFNINISAQVALIAIVGGMGTVFGPLLGAFIVIPLNELLRATFPEIHGMNYFIYGVLLIVIIIITPNGLYPILKKLWLRFFVKDSSKGAGN